MEKDARDAFKTLIAQASSSKLNVPGEDLVKRVVDLCISQPIETIRRVLEACEDAEDEDVGAGVTEAFLARQFGDVRVYDKILCNK